MEETMTNILKRVEKQQSNEAARKGQKLQLNPSPFKLRLEFRISAIQICAMPPDLCQMTVTSTHKIDASKSPMKDLKRITMGDLHLEEAAKGKYLILRTLERCSRLVGITTIVEDHKGNVILFSVYNLTTDRNMDLNDLLPAGTIFILKEPYVKISSSNECMLRCDCPTDLIVLFEGHPLYGLVKNISWKNSLDFAFDPVSIAPKPATAKEWKNRGNELFKVCKFEYAKRCYLLGLKAATNLDSDRNLIKILHLNLSAAYMELGFFEKALEFARQVLEVDPRNQKGLLRAGRANYRLRNYPEAKGYFEELHRIHPDNEDGKRELVKSNCRISEENGTFCYYDMFWATSREFQERIDCADYIGPVKIVEVPGKGRGVVATNNVQPGTLLVVSKALAFGCTDPKKIKLQVNVDKSGDFGSRQDLIAEVAQLIAKNPKKFGPVIYSLYNGEPSDATDPVKVFCDSDTKEEPIADVWRIKQILSTNCFGGNKDFEKHFGEKMEMLPKYGVNAGDGLYDFPSYFNHSCLPNATWAMFNDIMIIRATQLIQAGEEVFLAYFSWVSDFSERENMCKIRGFQCLCRLCKQERAEPEPILSKRSQILLQGQNICKDASLRIVCPELGARQFKKLIREMEASYATAEPDTLKISMSYLYGWFGESLMCSGLSKPNEAIAFYFSSLKLFGFDPQTLFSAIEKGENVIAPNAFLDQHVLYVVAKLIFIYHHIIRKRSNEKKWIQVMCALEKVYSGGSAEIIKLKYPLIKDII